MHDGSVLIVVQKLAAHVLQSASAISAPCQTSLDTYETFSKPLRALPRLGMFYLHNLGSPFIEGLKIIQIGDDKGRRIAAMLRQCSEKKRVPRSVAATQLQIESLPAERGLAERRGGATSRVAAVSGGNRR